MRDIAIALFALALLPLALRNSFVAVMMWCWAGLIGLNGLSYGFMTSIGVVQIFAMIALGGVVVRKEFVGLRDHMHGFSIILILMIVHGLASASLAYPGLDRNWELFSNMLKTALLCLVLPLFLVSRDRINIFVLLIASAISYHGVLDGLKYLSSLGGHNAAQAVFDLARNNGAPVALRDIGMKADDLDKACTIAMQNQYPNPRPLERGPLRLLLQNAAPTAP